MDTRRMGRTSSGSPPEIEQLCEVGGRSKERIRCPLRHALSAWWLVPVAVALLLTCSLRGATRKRR
jgi:hypothetical protein